MTDDHDDLLRRVLDGEAGRVRPTPDWDDVRRRAQRRRRRWLPAAAALVLLAMVTAVFALNEDDDERGVVADDPSRTSVPEQPTSTTAPTTEHSYATTSTTVVHGALEAGPVIEPIALPAGAALGDDEIVAAVVVPGGDFPEIDIVVLAESTGEIVRTLADGYGTVEGGVLGLTLTPDRRTVLYSVSTAACSSRIDAVAVDGSSEPVEVADGHRVAVSPDGSHLAVATGDPCTGDPAVDLLPLAGGQVVRYVELSEPQHRVESMAFVDGRRLLYVTAPMTATGDLQLRSLDLDAGTAVESHPAPEGTQYLSLDRHDGGISALEVPADGPSALVTINEREQIVDRQPVEADGEVTSIALDEGGSVYAVEPGGDFWLTVDGERFRQDVADFAV